MTQRILRAVISKRDNRRHRRHKTVDDQFDASCHGPHLQMIGDKSSKARHEHAVQKRGKGGRRKAEEQGSPTPGKFRRLRNKRRIINRWVTKEAYQRFGP